MWEVAIREVICCPVIRLLVRAGTSQVSSRAKVTTASRSSTLKSTGMRQNTGAHGMLVVIWRQFIVLPMVTWYIPLPWMRSTPTSTGLVSVPIEIQLIHHWLIGLTRDSSGGEIWSDGSQLSFTNWAPGEPSITDEDCTEADQNCNEDCVETYDNGMWNDIICQVKRAYVCKTPRPQKNCLDIPELEKDMCGYPGITQIECTATYQCCFNAYATIQCYSPQKKK